MDPMHALMLKIIVCAFVHSIWIPRDVKHPEEQPGLAWAVVLFSCDHSGASSGIVMLMESFSRMDLSFSQAIEVSMEKVVNWIRPDEKSETRNESAKWISQ